MPQELCGAPPQDVTTMLYYFLSTYAQSLAALLAVLITVYLFAKSVFGAAAQQLMLEMSRIRTGDMNALWSGTIAEALSAAEYFIGSGEPSARKADKTFLKEKIKELQHVERQLNQGIAVGRTFPELLCGVLFSIAAIPFVPIISKSWIPLGIIVVGLLLLLTRIGWELWETGKQVFHDALEKRNAP